MRPSAQARLRLPQLQVLLPTRGVLHEAPPAPPERRGWALGPLSRSRALIRATRAESSAWARRGGGQPPWQQLAQAVTIYRSGEAADTLREATDLTNELLQANADNLKTANRQVREQIERGVFDIEVVKRANQSLIETIQESLTIADEGKRRRVAASQQLETCEQELRKTLASASARRPDYSGHESASDGDGGD